MRLENLASPGIIPNSQKLRMEALKSLNFLAVVSTSTGSTSHAAALSAFFTACKAESDKFIRVAVTGVTVAPATSSGAAASTVQLTATIAPTGAQNKKVTWSTSNAAVATVSSDGLVTRVATGTATITATSQDDATKTGTSAITVT